MTMAEYINRDDLLKAAWDKPTLSLSVYDIGNIKPVDVAPVRHGRWIWHSEERGYLCSECGSGCLLNYESDWHKSDWCPHCGADMRGINDE